jgi:mono/diheme cytochrome c family protein
MKKLKNVVILGISALILSSCSFSRDKGSDTGSPDTAGINHEFLGPGGNLVVPAGAYPGYNTVKALIFQPYCSECHMNGSASGGVSLDTFGGAQANLQQIYQQVVVEQTMPLGASLSSADQAFVKAWYEGGGLEEDKFTNTPAPTPTFTPPAGIDPTFFDAQGNPVLPPGKYPGYNTLKATVLQNNCLQCHNSSNTQTLPHLDNYADAKAALPDIAQAVFVGKYMPAGGGKLSPNELLLMEAWYQADAPEQDLTTSQVPNPQPIPTPQPVASPLPIDPAYLGPNGTIAIPAGRKPGYSSVYSIVLAPNCVKCHNVNHVSAGVRVDTFEEAFASMDKINSEAQAGKMPPSFAHAAPVSKDRLAVLQAWVDAGGLETDQLP